MKQFIKKVSAILLAVCMLLGCAGGAVAENTDLEALYPLMDLVCAAALDAQGDDEYAIIIPDSEGELTEQFAASFIRLGQKYGQTLGITPEMMNDTIAQMGLLSQIFDAQLPVMSTVLPQEESSSLNVF